MDGFLQAADLRSAKTSQSVSAKKRRDPGGDAGKEDKPASNGENGSVMPMALPGAETKPKDISDIGALREQIDELQKQLLEKEEALRSAENTVSEMNAVYSTIDELRRQVTEKEALIKYTNSQLHNVKVSCCLPA
jgi:TolA-binding protein